MASITIGYWPILLGISAFLYLVFMVVTGAFQDVLNLFIASFPDAITQQTVSAAQFPIGILVASPAIILIALALWALVRASSGGSD